ncbi:MAG: 3-deoxy-manno-octulosonate cytidylyltransferase [Lentisphaeria bacterium]|nr:3-deoxy-manno-octulosonate cytidylyltransferase [Lentisphaeria bacterium]
MKRSRTVAVIPARYASSRFPGKPLAVIAGKPMIRRVFERTAACPDIDDVLVATDDERILATVRGFGGRAVMTRSDHATGTDRIAEAVRDTDAELVINVQGDEPLVPPEVLSRLVRHLRGTGVEMATAAVPFALTGRDPDDPNAVKVVRGGDGFALYFSRGRIPYCRQGGVAVEPLLHWGLYGYTRAFLERFVTWPRSPLEGCEMLEQLRALDHGVRIAVLLADVVSVGVDVPDDVARVEHLLRVQGLE